MGGIRGRGGPWQGLGGRGGGGHWQGLGGGGGPWQGLGGRGGPWPCRLHILCGASIFTNAERFERHHNIIMQHDDHPVAW